MGGNRSTEPSPHPQVAGTQPQPQQPCDDHVEDDDEQEDDHDAGLVDQQMACRVHEEHDGAQEQRAALHHLVGGGGRGSSGEEGRDSQGEANVECLGKQFGVLPEGHLRQ